MAMKKYFLKRVPITASPLETDIIRFSPVMDPLADLIVDEHAGEPADLEELAAFGELFGEVENLVLAHLVEVDRDAPGAGFGDDAVEGDDRR